MNTTTQTVAHGRQTFTIATNQRLNSSKHLLLFIHGLGCTKESFDGAFTAEVLSNYDILIPDLIGFGASDKPRDFSYTLEEQANILEQLIKPIAYEKISLIAHSMGGAIGGLLAYTLAQQSKPRLDHFINVEGNLAIKDCGLISRNTAAQSLEEFETKGYNEFLSELINSSRADLREWAVWYRKASPQAVHASARSMVSWSDSGELLTKFNTLNKRAYISGVNDPKAYMLPELRRTGTGIHLLPADHFMMIEKPLLFYTEVASILQADH